VAARANDAKRGLNTNGEVEAQQAHGVSKFAGVTVGRIGKDDLSGDFASGCALDHFKRQLALDPDRLFALLEKAGVVDDPRRDGLPLLDLFDGVAGGFEPNGTVIPNAATQKVQQLAVDVVNLFGVRAGTGRDRLGTLALAVPQNPAGVHGEGFPLPRVLQVSVDPAEKLVEPGCRPAARFAARKARCTVFQMN
jgi:hypothetical protein